VAEGNLYLATADLSRLEKASQRAETVSGWRGALEWAVRYPALLDRVGIIAAAGRLDPQGIALNEVGRRAIMLDSR